MENSLHLFIYYDIIHIMNKQYSFQKGLYKVIEFFVIASPIIIQAMPEQWLNLTIAGVLKLLVNYAKVKYLTA